MNTKPVEYEIVPDRVEDKGELVGGSIQEVDGKLVIGGQPTSAEAPTVDKETIAAEVLRQKLFQLRFQRLVIKAAKRRSELERAMKARVRRRRRKSELERASRKRNR